MATPNDDNNDSGLSSGMSQLDINTEKIEQIRGIISPKPEKLAKHHILIIVKKNKESEEYPLYVLRIQKVKRESSLNELKKEDKYPNLTILFESPADNPVNIGNILRERPGIEVKRNDIKLNDGYTEEQFVRDLRKITC